MHETPLLPWSLTGQLVGEVQNALRGHIDGQLRQLLNALKDGSLTFERAVCGLGHIEGHYAVLRELVRFQQAREERLTSMTGG